jgi:hypothetical protein
MLMRSHYGLGVGHVYSHRDILDPPPNTTIDPQEIIDDSNVSDDGGNNLENQESDESESEYDYTGVEEEVLFDQEKNGSTESIVEELDNMFIEHEFDYEP